MTPALTKPNLRKEHLIQSQRIWLLRAIAHCENGRPENAIKAMNECLEILRLIEKLGNWNGKNRELHTPRSS